MKSRTYVASVLLFCVAAPLLADDGIIIRRDERTLEQVERFYSEMPPVRYAPPAGRWEKLGRTKERLAKGGTLRVVMLGDSIVNDTSRSGWNLLLERRYPKCTIEKVTSVRGSTGCWWYKEAGRVRKFVLDHNPDLVIIGGISQRGDINSIRDCIGQIRADSAADILLMTGAFGSVDPCDQEQWRRISSPDHHDNYRKALENFVREVGTAFLDMEAAWAGYVRRSGKELDWFKRDHVHVNGRGEQILGRILAAYLSLPGSADSGMLVPVESGLWPNLFVRTDTCNIYVIKDGETAILIDLGDGSVLEHLAEIGVQRVEWVLFTHHHREQCQGYPRLKDSGAKVAVPQAERALFERPSRFRKMRPGLGDEFSVYGSSYVRPPVEPVGVDRDFAGMDTFEWHGYEFRCVHTPGNSPGGMSYLVKCDGRWLVFCGDVMLDGAKMHTWFDTEWDYGFAKGIYALNNSAGLLEDFDPVLLLPSHGPVVRNPKPQLQQFQKKLRHLERLYVRGYPVHTFAAADQDRVSKPMVIPSVWQITPHMFKFKGADLSPNFTLILADSGRGLVVDCGLLDPAFLDKSIELMQKHLGLKKIDATIITHMHGDHILEAPYLRDKWGAQIWTLDRIVNQFERPERYNYAAAVQAYGKSFESVRIDRAFKPGEQFEWEGYKFTVDWMPGQTEFALCMHADIDSRKVAFTGDAIFANPADPEQTGHEAMVAHNSAILEEGYIYVADYLRRLKLDLLVGGHSFVMDRPAELIERFGNWARQMRQTFQTLSADEDYRYWFDPFWVRAEPYRVRLQKGKAAEVTLYVRNFRQREQSHHIEIHVPSGIASEPAVWEGNVPGEAKEGFVVRLTAGADAPAGVSIVALDVTLDGQRYGQWFDFIVLVEL